MAALDPTAIVNRAINLFGDNQTPVTGSFPNFDDSAAGVAAASLYPGVVATVGRQFGWDFGRNVAALTLSGAAAPEPWLYEYLYPADGLEIRQVMPATIPDKNNPQTTNWTVGNTKLSGTPTKVIWSDDVGAKVVYTNNPPVPLWDSLFTETVVRLLAQEMAMAVAGKTDTSQKLLESAAAFENAGESRNG